MITLSALTIIMAIGVLQYSLEKGHPRFVIVLEVLLIGLMVSVLLSLSILNLDDREKNKTNIQKNLIDSVYATGYKKGLVDCNKK